jgi:hypothetical protein
VEHEWLTIVFDDVAADRRPKIEKGVETPRRRMSKATNPPTALSQQAAIVVKWNVQRG